ncbi:hypothetical protein D1631_05345 [Chryseobacterium nematophagum]|uniref:Uncharacterized protein n=1 Tax=Chryseobacterium nematophagum TaxID=2305228 RepID=A0A3M7TEU1_9FLAO|nr:hypothetical protein [Chryseobacterium nematophagum]RNA61397.1 hypothetical protein D1631_05345 [Chryseobacterium nematophagum]
MIKYSLIVLGVYFLYYAGNILYDLFLKNKKIVQLDVSEEFSLIDFADRETQSPMQIEIEDVENISTPKSFLKKELHSQKDITTEAQPEMEELRQRFEAEQSIDGFNLDESVFSVIESKSNEVPTLKKEGIKNKTTDWEELLKLSETTIQMVANYEGQKVYHSIL